MTVTVRRASAADLTAAYQIRADVFTVGQGVPADIERDHLDREAIHVIAERGDTVVGTGRLVVCGHTGMIGRMAVRESARGVGIGAAILSAIEQHAGAAGVSDIELHAQITARRFYERAGYACVGLVFLEAGLEHITMRKALPRIRPLADSDSEALIGLISACWAPYPGCVLDIDGEEPWLRAPATAYAGWGGAMWVATLDDVVVACVGLRPYDDHAELKSLYVAAAARRRGLGERLSRLVEDEARRRGYRRLELWTDTRFADAHRLYQRLGYERLAETRDLDDLSNSTEWHFVKVIRVV